MLYRQRQVFLHARAIHVKHRYEQVRNTSITPHEGQQGRAPCYRHAVGFAVACLSVGTEEAAQQVLHQVRLPLQLQLK